MYSVCVANELLVDFATRFLRLRSWLYIIIIIRVVEL